ncbi:DUF2484 family protein [Yoonia sp. 208BN28-4]|uniref:DUF2484 family protein n=1 Tax=Yoonia sp. 208BN28-4 TaxID=3126505 RepID=UPI0030B27186
MSGSIIFGALWVVASAIVAFLPMQRQYVPGIALLCLAPVLIVWLGIDHGWLVGLAATAAFVSMFRNPLIYIYRRLAGQNPEVPK